MALSGLAEETASAVSDSDIHIVSPQPNKQVQELQDLFFPSLPHICSEASLRDLDTKEATKEEDQDSPSYGWFVSTDDAKTVTAEEEEDQNKMSSSTFLPDLKPVLASTSFDSPSSDLKVQQALAEDTIDDVLGDLF